MFDTKQIWKKEEEILKGISINSAVDLETIRKQATKNMVESQKGKRKCLMRKR